MQGSTGDSSGGGRVPSRSGVRPRPSNYLRISPTTVLQMILYLEPAHVEWMNVRPFCPLSFRPLERESGDVVAWADVDDDDTGLQDSVLERMLLALRDRIPLKLAQEGPGKAKGREKTQVDVFRGGQSRPLSLSLRALAPHRTDGSSARTCAADYQMAFFFRRASDKHVVLLKVHTTSPLEMGQSTFRC